MNTTFLALLYLCNTQPADHLLQLAHRSVRNAIVVLIQRFFAALRTLQCSSHVGCHARLSLSQPWAACDLSLRWPRGLCCLPRVLATKTPWQQIWSGDLVHFVSGGHSGTKFIRWGREQQGKRSRSSFQHLQSSWGLSSQLCVPGFSINSVRRGCRREWT